MRLIPKHSFGLEKPEKGYIRKKFDIDFNIMLDNVVGINQYSNALGVDVYIFSSFIFNRILLSI